MIAARVAEASLVAVRASVRREEGDAVVLDEEGEDVAALRHVDRIADAIVAELVAPALGQAERLQEPDRAHEVALDVNARPARQHEDVVGQAVAVDVRELEVGGSRSIGAVDARGQLEHEEPYVEADRGIGPEVEAGAGRVLELVLDLQGIGAFGELARGFFEIQAAEPRHMVGDVGAHDLDVILPRAEGLKVLHDVVRVLLDFPGPIGPEYPSLAVREAVAPVKAHAEEALAVLLRDEVGKTVAVHVGETGEGAVRVAREAEGCADPDAADVEVDAQVAADAADRGVRDTL